MACALGVRAVALIFTVPMTLLGSLSAPTLWQTSLFWVVWFGYFGWAASQFSTGTRWRTWLRGAVVAANGHALIIGVLILGIAVDDAMKKTECDHSVAKKRLRRRQDKSAGPVLFSQLGICQQ